MRHIKIDSKEELDSALSDLRTSHYFRGQTKHYVHEGGFQGFPTSFQRHGCIPRRMRRWACYARDILHTLADPPITKVPIELSQALLQHYGWRSFFLDLSASPEVSSWFASHSFSEQESLALAEDQSEIPVTLHYKLASYATSSEQRGHLYAISRDALESSGIGVHDLCSIMSEMDCRPTRQQALVAGPLSSHSPADCVTHHIEGPRSILADFAARAGFRSQEDLFPKSDEDLFYQHFLREPWIEIEDGTYGRALDMPIYEQPKTRFVEGAFHKPTWVSADLGTVDPAQPSPEHLRHALIIRAPDDIMFGFGKPTATFPLSYLRSLLSTHGSVIIESDGLYQFPVHEKHEFIKGVIIETAGEGRVNVSDLSVSHPGSQLLGWGVMASRQYAWTPSNCLVASPAEADCPCNYELRHERQLETLCCVESEAARLRPVTGTERLLELPL